MKKYLLSNARMAQADQHTIKGGTPGISLMRNAGAGCTKEIIRRFAKSKTLVLCGSGNNGGDGFVIARLLEEAGWEVSVSLLVTPDRLTGDAKLAYEEWILAARTPVLALFTPAALQGVGLVIDAVFGAGLTRAVGSPVIEMIEAVAQSQVPVMAVDLPSGVNGDDGRVLGAAFEAALTVTFFRKKAAHVLFPGRRLCGECVVADIGIPDSVLDAIAPTACENDPGAWLAEFPWPGLEGHKYQRGHCVVVSGGASATGAARLAARAALRQGAGLVTVASPASAVLVNAAHLTSVMVRGFRDQEGFESLVADERLNTFVIGPGNGVGETTRSRVLHLLSLGRPVVLDADALTSFEGHTSALFDALHGQAVLTPHAGEFRKLFPDLDKADKQTAAREAARQTGAIVVLKGPDTVIAAPDGHTLINTNAPATLATAGSGDVLAGLIAGLMAQGMAAFEAAGASVWIHSEAANLFGLGLISEDLPDLVPEVLDLLEDLRAENPAIGDQI